MSVNENKQNTEQNPVRVLQVVTSMDCGGIENMLMNYHRAIDCSKVQFDYLVHRPWKGFFEDEIESLGGRVFRIPRQNPCNPKYWMALNLFFQTHCDYAIVHSHINSMSSLVLLAAERAGVSCRIAHAHCSTIDKDIRYPIKMGSRLLLPKSATDFFACGEAAGDFMFRGRPYSVLNNAIETSRFCFNCLRRAQKRRELGFSIDDVVIGSVGRLDSEKNPLGLIEILEIVHNRLPNSRLLWVGDGSLRREAEKSVAEKGLTEFVTFTGVRDDVPELMQAMDVFLLPSFYEGLPVVAVEAQASGLPCLCSDRITSEVAITDLCEFLPLKKPEVWAQAVIETSRVPRRAMVERVRAAGYDIEDTSKWLQNFYLSVALKRKVV